MTDRYVLRRTFRLELTDALSHPVTDDGGTELRLVAGCRYLVAAFKGTGPVWARPGGLDAAPGAGIALTQEVGPRELAPRSEHAGQTLTACKDAAADDDTVISVEEWEPVP